MPPQGLGRESAAPLAAWLTKSEGEKFSELKKVRPNAAPARRKQCQSCSRFPSMVVRA